MDLKGLRYTAAYIRAAYDCTTDATVFHFIEDALAEIERLERLELNKAERLLQLFTKKFPPPENCVHLFKLRQDGKPGLELLLNINGTFNSFGFEPEDFDKPDNQIVQEISLLFQTVTEIRQKGNGS
jgi:hypothetical protein